MILEQIYTNCLAEAAYYIESNGEALIIDPLRETDPYLERAKKNNAKIKYIFETHFHADFVSGHVDLAKKTGATIVYGPTAKTGYNCHIATDNEVFKIGNITITVLHTPGHTLESCTYLLKDETGKNHAIFTGDTLFIGDVGRPDLAIKSDLTQSDLAGMLYDSLHKKIMPLEDDVLIYPAHGAGSACGKNMSSETFSTLGEQKKFNYALQNIGKELFIKELITGILPAPQYFSKDAYLNKNGYTDFESVLKNGQKALNIAEFEQEMNIGVLVLDTRKKNDFAEGHIPNSLFIGLDGTFAPWVGTLINDLDTPILLVTEKGREEEAITRLARVGYDNVKGYLDNGFEAWKNSGKPVKTIECISAEEIEQNFSEIRNNIIDVRKPAEYEAGHLTNASNHPLDFINDNDFDNLNKENKYYLHCKSGYRSLIAASILQQRGFTKLINIEGGFNEISKTKLPIKSLVEAE